MEEERAVLSFGKSVDDIEEAVPMPEDWYPAEIRELPKKQPNKAKKNDPHSEKAGDNWEVPIKIESDEEEYDGRYFTLYFPLPKPGDDERRTPGGQKMEDALMERIRDFCICFDGKAQGNDVAVSVGGKGMVYVRQEVVEGAIRNSINVFAGFKPLLDASDLS